MPELSAFASHPSALPNPRILQCALRRGTIGLIAVVLVPVLILAGLLVFLHSRLGSADQQGIPIDQIVFALFAVVGLVAFVVIPVAVLSFRRIVTGVNTTCERALLGTEFRADELRVTLHSIGDAVLATDGEGTVTFLNAEAERLIGWSAAEARGRPMGEVLPLFNEKTGEPAVNPIERVLREKVVVGLANHTVLRQRSGREVPIEDSAAPIFHHDGSIRGVILVFHDVTEKHAQSRALQLAEWLSRTALEVADAGAYAWEVAADRVTADANMGRLFAIETAAREAGAPIATYLAAIHPADLPAVQAAIAHTTETGADYNVEYRVYAQGGAERWVNVRGRMERNAAGKLDRLVGVAQDTTARRKAEAELREAKARAEEAMEAVADGAERFRVLSETVSMHVWTAKPDGGLDWANQYVVRYFGVTDLEREVYGSAWTQFVHPEDLPVASARWAESISTGCRYEAEFRLRSGAACDRWFLVRAEAMRNAAGEIVRWFGVNTDIHDLKIAQQTAEVASKAKDDFLAALSHELRTPLTPVLMCAAALRDDPRLPADVHEQLRMMERNIALEGRLIDDLLDITRIANGKLSLRTQMCDAHSLINLAVEIVRDEARAKAITLERDFTAERSGLLADPARIQQVIWNLMRNAVKFTPRGGSIAIRTTDCIGAEGGDTFRVEVRDSGIGIAPAAMAHIFHPFEQGPIGGDHRFGGLGLGLSIARAIVELHRGEIHAESEGLDRGATFVVTFPGATEPPHGAHDPIVPLLPTSGLEPSPRPVGVDPLTILLVEDHDATLAVLTRLLTRAGHRVRGACTITSALEMAASETFDAVISDLGLPDGTGTELMEKLRDRYGLRGIALSGYGMEDDLVRSRKAGFITHLVKPVDFEQLQHSLRELMSKAKTDRKSS